MAMDDAMLVRGVESGTADMGKAPADAGDGSGRPANYVGTTLSHLLFAADKFVNNASTPVHSHRSSGTPREPVGIRLSAENPASSATTPYRMQQMQAS
jgi:hypothetical protein